MKILNEVIDVDAKFYSAGGVIMPLKFRRESGQVVEVEKVLKTYVEKPAGNERVVFVCQHKGQFIYELKFEPGSRKWYLFKK